MSTKSGQLHAVQTLDERAHLFERPQLGAETVGDWTLQQRTAQRIKLRAVKLRRTARGHRTQCVDAALIEPGPGWCRLVDEPKAAGRERQVMADYGCPGDQGD